MKKIALLILLAGCSSNLGSSLGKRPDLRGLTADTKHSEELVSINTVSIAPIRCFSANCPNPAVVTALTNDLMEAFVSQSTIEAISGTGADAVLSTSFNNFEERQGSAAGASKPAVVDFTMRLVKKDDGKEIWSAIYHFKDEALTDNLLGINNRVNDAGQIGWKNAREIAKSAFSAAIKSLDANRTAQFTGSTR